MGLIGWGGFQTISSNRLLWVSPSSTAGATPPATTTITTTTTTDNVEYRILGYSTMSSAAASRSESKALTVRPE